MTQDIKPITVGMDATQREAYTRMLWEAGAFEREPEPTKPARKQETPQPYTIRRVLTGIIQHVAKVQENESSVSMYRPTIRDGIMYATCPKCKTVAAYTEFGKVSPYKYMLPKFDTCPTCHGDDDEKEYCVRCEGRGWIVKGTIETWPDMACITCVNELAGGRTRASGNGYAVVYTSPSRAGEPGLFPTRDTRAHCAFHATCGNVVDRDDVWVCKPCRKEHGWKVGDVKVGAS